MRNVDRSTSEEAAASGGSVVDDKTLQALRLKYKAAHAAYANCRATLSELNRRLEPPSKALLDGESKALKELTDAREALLGALTKLSRQG